MNAPTVLDKSADDLGHLRTLLVLTLLMAFGLSLIDPPFTVFGKVLYVLVLIILTYVLVHLHRYIIGMKSSAVKL